MTSAAPGIPGTPAAPSAPAERLRGHYGFAQVARMEWIKLRTLRSTWWTLAITAVGSVGMGVAIGFNTRNAAGDLTNNALAGMVPGLLFTGVLGVLAMTGEYTSGTIRATLTAAPRRVLLLAAKSAVFGAVTLALGEASAFVSFFAAGAALRHGIAAPTLGQPGVLQAVALSGTSFCLIGLLGLGLGAIIRHSPAAIGVLVGGVYVLAQMVGAFSHSAGIYMPILIVGNSISTTRTECVTGPGNGAQCIHFLSPWTGFGMLCLYAAVPLVIGGWLLARRDA
ncbi:MAG: ABC transporter permease subunit [Nocardiopsaceae bacterium]|nr:ABC transporter permease subunit [Nocardiopsaceae bacterium]